MEGIARCLFHKLAPTLLVFVALSVAVAAEHLTTTHVILPVASGGVIATGVLVFVLDWNLFLLPTLLADRPPHMLTVMMRDFFAFERDLEWPTAAAALLVSVTPAFLLVFATQRALEGLTLVPQEESG